MARRATELNEDAKFRLNGINNLERVFRGADIDRRQNAQSGTASQTSHSIRSVIYLTKSMAWIEPEPAVDSTSLILRSVKASQSD